MKITTIFISISCLFTHIAYSHQGYNVNNYSVVDGLAQDNVTDMLQDSRGFMWFATWNGLSRFDGTEFKSFKSHPTDKVVMGSNRINSIVEDAAGNIWCLADDRNVYMFDVRRQCFVSVANQWQPNSYMNISELKRIGNHIWLVSSDGICYRTSSDSSGHIEIDAPSANELRGKQIYRLSADADKNVWILSDKGAFVIGKTQINESTVFTHFAPGNNAVWLASNTSQVGYFSDESNSVVTIENLKINQPITAFYCCKSANVLAIGTANGKLILYNLVDNATSEKTIANGSSITSIRGDKRGYLWLQNDNGDLFCCDATKGDISRIDLPKIPDMQGRYSKYNVIEDRLGKMWIYNVNGYLYSFDHDDNKLTIADSRVVHLCYADSHGNMWINPISGGLSVLKKYNVNYRHVPTIGSSKPFSEVRSLMTDSQGRLWVGAKDATLRLFSPNGELLGYLSVNGTLSKTRQTLAGNAYCISEDAQHRVWVGCRYAGLYIFTPNKYGGYSVSHLLSNSANVYSLSSNDVYSILHDSNGVTWIGCYGGGLNMVRLSDDNQIMFVNSKNELTNYPTEIYDKIRYLTQIDDKIVVSTGNGLLTFDINNQLPSATEFKQINGLSAFDNVMQTIVSPQRCLYSALLGGGLVTTELALFNADSVKWKSIETDDMMQSVVCGTDSTVWATSEYAIYKLSHNTVEKFNSQWFNANINFSEAPPVVWNGNMVWSTNDGFIVVDPKQLTKSKTMPSIVFTSLKVNGLRPSDADSLICGVCYADTIALQSSQRNVTISFSALDFSNSRNIQYAYKMDGVDSDWYYMSKGNSATYVNIPCGIHKFVVRSTNCDGVWGDNAATITIVVNKKFTETYLFILLCILMVLALTAAIIFITQYIYKLRHAVDVERQVYDMKLQFFTNISHELRTPLTLIASPVDEVLSHETLSDESQKNLQLVKSNADRMLQLVGQLLDFRKLQDQQMKLHVELTDISAAIDAVAGNFKPMTARRNITLLLPENNQHIQAYVDIDKFEKIISNLLSNAVKYTPDNGHIEISTSVANNNAIITVSDSGIGIDSKYISQIFDHFSTVPNATLQPSTGIGLALVREFVQMHHGDIKVESCVGKGSTFTVSLPLGKEIFSNEQQIDSAIVDESDDEGSDLSLLIVEDNVELRQFLTSVLHRDYTVFEAANGSEGLSAARQYMPDIIVTDIMMPVMDGNQMIKALRSNADLCHIPIVVLTAKTSVASKLESIGNGADDYITKPFSAKLLKLRVDQIVGRMRQAQHNVTEKMAGTCADIEPMQPQIIPADNNFINKVMEFMEANMDNSSLAIDDFATVLATSRTVFYRKLKTITGLSPVDFVKEMRVKRAMQLIDASEMPLSQVAFMTGFNDPKYFSKCFKKLMGITPSEYKEKSKQNQNREQNGI